MRLTLPLISFAIATSACADPDHMPTATKSALPTAGVAFSARAKPVPNPRAEFVYYSVAPSGTGGRLIGDERGALGATTPGLSTYDDGECGVTAEIFISGSGDATMDPTGTTVLCGSARALSVEFGRPLGSLELPLTPTSGSFFTNVRDVLSLTGTEPQGGERRFRLLLRGFVGCDYLRYENVEGSDGRLGTSDDVSFGTITGKNIRVTRLPDVLGKRQWLAESQAVDGAHVAFCEKVGKRGSTYAGAYDIPFRLEVHEQ
jgi:hypothetical protein